MHPLVVRQVRRYFKDTPPEDPRVQALLQAVSDAYQAADDDSQLLERTLALASAETEAQNKALVDDIERRERAENERDAFFRTSPDMMAIVDHQMKLVQVNDSWNRVLGYEPAALPGRSFVDLIHPDDVPRVLKEADEATQIGKIISLEFRQRHQTGHWRHISAAATLDAAHKRYFVVSRDVTEQREMSRELAQCQKLEAVGQLASGVAHEINTPVQYVGDNIDFIGEGLTHLFEYISTVDGVLTDEQRAALSEATEKAELPYYLEELPRSLTDAREGVRRVGELVRALKEFAHPDANEKTPADINKALERAVVLARGELKHLARLELALGPLPPVRCHIGSLSQVFLNLLVNAAHAVEERSAKQGISWDAHLIRVTTDVENDEVVINVSDTGCGIPDSVRERIFEPFFTTKPMGKGSGQGLPLVRNVVVVKHGGRIEIDTEVNVGTTFRLRIPMSGSGVFLKVA
jgi:PAS domain S-box-containing protein